MADDLLRHVWFASFADRRLAPSLRRIKDESATFGFSNDHTAFWDEKCLDVKFVERMGSRFSSRLRGFGYWCWKPQVWLQMLERMPEGDVLLYLDAGCHLNDKGKRRFAEYLSIMDATDILGFQSRSLKGTPDPDPRHHRFVDRDWTKGDMLDYFGVRGNEAIAGTGQFAGGIVLLRNHARVRDFVRRFRELYYERFELLDDSPSKSPDEPGFKGHRHDQSAFGIMCKLEGYDRHSLSKCELFPILRKRSESQISEMGGREMWGFTSFAEMDEYPLQAIHDKRLSPLSRLAKNIRAAFGRDTEW